MPKDTYCSCWAYGKAMLALPASIPTEFLNIRKNCNIVFAEINYATDTSVNTFSAPDALIREFIGGGIYG